LVIPLGAQRFRVEGGHQVHFGIGAGGLFSGRVIGEARLKARISFALCTRCPVISRVLPEREFASTRASSSGLEIQSAASALARRSSGGRYSPM
jgi:hypothetical protein